MPSFIPNIRHLRAYAAVARHGGVSAASNHVHLSQPAITQAIAGFEKRLDIALFQRLPGGMRPTAEGQILLGRIERALDQLACGATEARATAGQGGGRQVRFDHLMTAAQLRALIALSGARNFTLAARQTGISQPSIHRAARALERLAGVALFAATGQGVALTRPAQALARRARLALGEWQQGISELAAIAGQDTTRITIGSMPLARATILPRAMDAMLQLRPDVQLCTIEGPYNSLLHGLRYGDSALLIGAMRSPAPSEDVVQDVLFMDSLAIVARRDHPLAGRSVLRIEETLAYPWVAPPRTTPAGSYLYKVLDIGSRAKTPVRVVTSSQVLLRALLLEGDYLSIISRRQVQGEIDRGLLAPLPVALPANSRPIGLTTRRGWQPTPTEALFLRCLRMAARDG